jgi:hypothetical protein
VAAAARQRAADDARAAAAESARVAAESARAAAHAAGERAALARIELIRSAAREVAAARDAAAATAAQHANAERVSADLHATAMESVVERAAAERVEAAAHLAAMQAAERRAGEERTTAVRDATRCAAAVVAAEVEAQVAASLLIQSLDERTGAPVTVANVVLGMRVLPGHDFTDSSAGSLFRTGGVVTCTADVTRTSTCKVTWDTFSASVPPLQLHYSIGGAAHRYELMMEPPIAVTHVRVDDAESYGGAEALLPASASPADVSLRRSAVLRVIVGAANNQGSMVLTVPRADVLATSMRKLGAPGGRRWAQSLMVDFDGDAGVGPGIVREWFSALSDEMASLPCFVRTPAGEDGSGESYFDPAAVSDSAALAAAAFAGALMGKVIRESSGKNGHRNHHTLGGLRLALPLFRHLAGEDVGPARLSELDSTQATVLAAMLATPGGADDLGGATHALETYDAEGQLRVYDLLPDGAELLVTEANKGEYVRLRALWWLTQGVQPLLTALMDGFDSLVPRDVVKALGISGLELQRLICGAPVLDLLGDVRRHTRLGSPYTADTPVIVWLWEVLATFSADMQLRFWRFCTGGAGLPAGGAAALAIPFSVVYAVRSSGPGMAVRLPISHTCFRRLDLPAYESKEELERSLITALENSEDGAIGLV